MIGADVGGGPFPTDMLFPGGQSQHEAPFAIHICGLTHQTSRHVAHIWHPGGKHPQGRSSERAGNSQTLAFSAGDIRSLAAGIFHQPVSQRFAESDNKKRFFRPGLIPNDFQIFDTTKKIGRLHDHCSQIIQGVQR